jgi:hypothetical protein
MEDHNPGRPPAPTHLFFRLRAPTVERSLLLLKSSLRKHRVHRGVEVVEFEDPVPHPAEQPVRLTIGELAQPAVLRLEAFLYSFANPSGKPRATTSLSACSSGPVLIVEHHEIFQRPDSLVEIAARINSVASELHRSKLATVVGNSILTRRAPDGTHHVRAYSCTVRISNDSGSIRCYSIEWGDSCDGASIEHVLVDGTRCCGFEIDDAGLRLSVELAPGSSQTSSEILSCRRS